MKYALVFSLVFILLVGCGGAPEDRVIKSGYDQQEMDEAIARAGREVDSFKAELAKPTGTGHAVKVPITDGGETEFFWLNEVTFQNGEFHGTINNDPEMVGNVKLGQKWQVKQGEIADWMFVRDGKMYGNYTLRPLLKAMPPEEAAMYRAMLANP